MNGYLLAVEPARPSVTTISDVFVAVRPRGKSLHLSDPRRVVVRNAGDRRIRIVAAGITRVKARRALRAASGDSTARSIHRFRAAETLRQRWNLNTMCII